MAGQSKSGSLEARRSELPFMRRIDILWKIFLIASSSSTPLALAWALAIPLSSRTVVGCIPPKDPIGRGTKTIHSSRKSSLVSLHLMEKAVSWVWPGCSAEEASLGVVRRWTTVTSRAVFLPPVQCGMKMSAGLLFFLGIEACSSFLGPTWALWAAAKIAFLRWLCLAISSPLLPHTIAWSPCIPLGLPHEGHGPSYV